MSLFENIQSIIPTLSEAKRNVAYYILDNWMEVAFLPASQVARNAKVSESVVVRFSQDIGFSGFPDFQRNLQKILKSRLFTSQSSELEKNETFEDSNREIVDVYHKALNNIEKVFKHNSLETFQHCLDKIIDAERVLILARKNSLGVAQMLNVHINEVYAKSVIYDGDTIEALDFIRGLNEKDLVIFISIPAYSKRMITYSDYVKERNIPQLAITNSYQNEFAKNADHVLLTSVDSLAFSNSHVGTIFIVDILMHLLTEQNKAYLLKFLEETKMLNERFGISK